MCFLQIDLDILEIALYILEIALYMLEIALTWPQTKRPTNVLRHIIQHNVVREGHSDL